MIRNLNHVGISVSNLALSVRFYRDLLGMTVVGHGAFSGERYDRILDLEGVTGTAAMLERDGLRVELFEFSVPQPVAGNRARPVCDHGITHFCIEVSEIDEEYSRLKAAGVEFHCAPIVFPGIAKATYARDPDGNVIELLEHFRESTHD